MRSLLALLAGLLLTLGIAAPDLALGAPALDPMVVPEPLKPWVPWVRSRHPELACARAGDGAICRWPARLEVDADARGASFVLDVTLDRDGEVALPGGAGAWPADVRVGGRAIPVIERDGAPTSTLPAGTHRLTGAMRWTSRPTSLAVPFDIGVIALRVDGSAVERPALDSDGRLRLAESEGSGAADSSLEIDVSRRIADGVPVVVTTRIDLRASGVPRELDLGLVAVSGTSPVQLDADIPARFDEAGHLIVLVRPGTWSITFEALHEGPAMELAAPALGEPWPSIEYWAWQPNEPVRAATPSGPPGVDPSRTPLPEAWRRLAAFRVAADDPLRIDELRRGEPDPPPNALSLRRELWLDLDGQGFTVRDQISGTMRRGWRLDARPPLELGHAVLGGDDQVVTQGEGGMRGIEVRSTQIDARAESRLLARGGALPAVGWATDVERLSATVHLPPGWSVFAALGVDSVGRGGSWIGSWNLWDLFFVLVVALATGRVVGWRWGAVALVALTVGRHEPGAPAWIWAVLVATIAAARVVPWPWARTGGRIGVWVLLVALALQLVPWGVVHLREGVWPATAPRTPRASVFDAIDAVGGAALDSPAPMEDFYQEETRAKPSSRAPSSKSQVAKKRDLALQYDPGAQIQTGPGVPTWAWRRVDLSWSGPVPAEHEVRLVLVSPWQTGLLALLRVALMLALAFGFAATARRLSGDGRRSGPAGDEGTGRASAAGAAGAALLLLGLVASPADAAEPSVSPAPPTPPAGSVLDELEARLLAAPACRPSCVSVGEATLRVSDALVRIEATVHAEEDGTWPVPGPAATWTPARVSIDGVPAAIARRSDGHLHARVPRGAHRIVVEGPPPASDAITLTWGARPQRLESAGDGWSIEGRRADGSAEPFAQLTRVARGEGAEAARTDALAPWVEVERILDLGVPWRVRTTVRRLGPAAQPLAIRVPLLEGESVTDAGYEGEGAYRLVTLARDEREVSFVSTLAIREVIELRAPEGVAWSEVWRVACSPVFACAIEGPAPIHHTADGRWAPVIQPWPGEVARVRVGRPEGAEGATTTIDSALLRLTPGRRQLTAELDLSIRTSQGGTQAIALPEGARLTRASVDGREQPLQVRDDGAVHVPLSPGAQRVVLGLLQDAPTGAWFQGPEISLGGPAVNVRVEIEAPEERWIVGLFGPAWGPTPLYLVYLVLVGVGAFILARIAHSPLALWQWALLGLGMTQVPVLVPLIVAGWLFALRWRGRHPPANPWVFNGVQLGLVGYTAVALICLYAAVHAGLLFDPDMQIVGNDSSNRILRWYVDRIDGALPRPAVLSLPLWTWRVAMLAWALWLAISLLAWIRRGAVDLGTGGWVRPLPIGGPGPRAVAPTEELERTDPSA